MRCCLGLTVTGFEHACDGSLWLLARRDGRSLRRSEPYRLRARDSITGSRPRIANLTCFKFMPLHDACCNLVLLLLNLR